MKIIFRGIVAYLGFLSEKDLMNPKTAKHSILAQLPQVDKLLQHPSINQLTQTYPRNLIVNIIREELDLIRKKTLTSTDNQREIELNRLIDQIVSSVKAKLQPSLRRAINATGIVLHTGLGRAPLSLQAKEALLGVVENFSTLEIDLESGRRGNRYVHVENLLCQLTGAEAAMVINNNAAATFLILNTLSFQKESIVSRGELITIGGSFRLPEIMKRSGAIMVDIGTTNHTYLLDYREAITENTALLMKVHTSNYKISGFMRAVSVEELVELGQQFNLPVYHDTGSGSLIDLSRYGLPKEPVVRESIEAGADIVSFSGDKLLGGPQAGIIVGKKDLIDLMKENHLTRIIRAGKLTYAALEATLKLFCDEAALIEQHAVMRLLTKSMKEMKSQTQDFLNRFEHSFGNNLMVSIEEGLSEVGGGSLATESLPTILLYMEIKNLSADELAKQLRLSQPPIIGRIHKHKVCFDMRTIREDEVDFIIESIKKIIQANA